MEEISSHGGAYVRHEIRVISAFGKPIPVLQGNPAPGEIIAWLDDTRLALASTEQQAGTVVVAYPFSGAVDTLLPSFDDISTYEHDPWSPYDYERGQTVPTALYSPDLTQVAYLRFTGNATGLSFISVRDAITNKLLWTGPQWTDARPTWLQSGHQLLTTSDALTGGKGDELYLVRPGEGETRLTDFAAMFPSFFRVSVISFALAPDEAHVAFTVCAMRSRGSLCAETVMLFSLRTGILTDLCQTGERQAIIWSPDSRYILIPPDTIFNSQDFTRLGLSLPGIPEAWLVAPQ